MITTKQEKDKTTIIISRRLKKSELKSVLNYISLSEETLKRNISKKKIREIADEVSKGAWEKIKKKRGFTWS